MEAIPWEQILGTEGGIWVVVVILLVRERMSAARAKTGPDWVRNGAFEDMLDRVMVRLKRAEFVSDAQVDLRDVRDLAQRTWDIHQRRDEEGNFTWDTPKSLVSLGDKLEKSAEATARMVTELDRTIRSRGDLIEEQTQLLRGIAREMNAFRICPHTTEGAERIMEELERKKKLQSDERARELGLGDT